MKKIKELIKLKKPKKNFRYEWTAMADELSRFYKKNCYWLFWKYPKQKIYEAHRECERRKIASIKYLLAILKH
jgi:hypothetical protein